MRSFTSLALVAALGLAAATLSKPAEAGVVVGVGVGLPGVAVGVPAPRRGARAGGLPGVLPVPACIPGLALRLRVAPRGWYHGRYWR